MTYREGLWLTVVIAAGVAGCLGEEDPRYSGGTIDAQRVTNTTGVPVNDVARKELAGNDDVLKAVEEAHENGVGGHDLSESDVDAAGRFLEGYETYKPRRFRQDKPAGTYFVYRNQTIAVWITSLQ